MGTEIEKGFENALNDYVKGLFIKVEEINMGVVSLYLNKDYIKELKKLGVKKVSPFINLLIQKAIIHLKKDSSKN